MQYFGSHKDHGCNPLADGLWVCCCRAENQVIHFLGDHPFKHLRCVGCDHIICEKCCTTDIIKVLGDNSIRVMGPELHSGPMFGRICSSCGLTHHAFSQRTAATSHSQRTLNDSHEDTLCVCGARISEMSLKFSVGLPDDHRYNPDASSAYLAVQRAQKATKRAYQRPSKVSNRPPFRPPGSSRSVPVRTASDPAIAASINMRRRAQVPRSQTLVLHPQQASVRSNTYR